MTHTYNITGMTCSSCSTKVKSALLMLPDVTSAEVSINPGKAVIQMQSHIPLKTLTQAVAGAGNYAISESGNHQAEMKTATTASWLTTYKPILLIGVFISIVSFLTSFHSGQFNFSQWMTHFMAGFFIAFSFFKFLDLRGFADSYSTYDLLAMRWRVYGFIYPYLELALGIAFIVGYQPMFTNSFALALMTFSSLGVIRSLVNKQKIQCACLGTVFNLPMSTVTLVEDGLMMVMSAAMLFMM